MTYIDITGINKDNLLKELWKNSGVILFDIPFDLNRAKLEMENNYPDYVCGRLIKLDIYNCNQVNPHLYNRENGNKSFEEILNEVKKIETKLFEENLNEKKEEILENKNIKFESILSDLEAKSMNINQDVLSEAKKLYSELF